MYDEPVVQLDKQKLKDVVHYVCSKCDQSELGNVKLHKILYFADMLYFQETGTALTGVEYQKQQFGPVARHLTWALRDLESEGRIEVREREYFGFAKKDFVSLQAPRMDRLGNKAPKLLDDVIDFICARSAREISELSHNAAWQAAEMGEVIPYFTAMGLEPSEVTDEDMAWGIQEAQLIVSDSENNIAVG
jgi:uncharacterized phage-associated protein